MQFAHQGFRQPAVLPVIITATFEYTRPEKKNKIFFFFFFIYDFFKICLGFSEVF